MALGLCFCLVPGFPRISGVFYAVHIEYPRYPSGISGALRLRCEPIPAMNRNARSLPNVTGPGPGVVVR